MLPSGNRKECRAAFAMMGGGQIYISMRDIPREGLYLVFEDSARLELTRESIAQKAEEYWRDPAKIPPEVKKAVEFQRCPCCPLCKRGGFCNALRPVLPLLETVDRYMSYDRVTAIYRGSDPALAHVSETTVQGALKYLCVISLTQYCRVGWKYRKYYTGIMPLADPEESSLRMYLNIYWLMRGRREEIEGLIARFRDEMRIASENQVKRLAVICKRDAFVNAFVNAQVALEFLSLGVEEKLERAFADRGGGHDAPEKMG